MKGLRITGIDLYRATIDMISPFRIALGLISEAAYLFVRVRTDAGVEGWGEATPISQITGDTASINHAAAVELGRLLPGRDPLDVDGRVRDLRRHLANNTSVHAAYDMALHDIAAKVARLPLFALLGGGRRTLMTDVTIGIDDPDSMAERAARLRDDGVGAIKVKLGTTAAEDVLRIERIRRAVGPDLPLRIDANQGWDLPTALEVLRRLEGFGIQYCEQPLLRWDVENLRRLRNRVSIPIMADESVFDHHDAFRLAAAGACDYFNIKLAKSGGIHAALKIDAIAEAAGLRCMLGCMMETRLGLTAAAHLASARPNIAFVDLDGFVQLKADPVIGGAEWSGGTIELPEEPGIGAAIDPAFLDGCELTTVE